MVGAELAGQVAIVTGGARGIGRAIAIELGAAGAAVVLNYNNSEKAANELLSQLPSGSVAVQADVSTQEGVDAIFAAADELGGASILVNNAGITRDGLLPMMPDEDWLDVINTNATATFRTCRAATKRMMRERKGSIVNITSISAIRGNAGQTNYSASKAAVVGLTRSLARELGRRNIRINCVAPGFIDTDMTSVLPDIVIKAAIERIPLRRMGKPEEIASMVRFLCGPDSSYISGQLFVVDGGMSA
jgi:3-oxoacyl-[acyl-carrier protein] reductase